MNIVLAKTFLEVVAAGSMSIAADRLNVTHSTVTVRIKNLEENILRRPVLVRSRSGVQLTADGVRFKEFAESLVRTWQMARRHMSLASGFEGIMSIGIDRTMWGGLMRDWVYRTRQQRPEVAMRVECDSSPNLVQRLFEGWLDVCVIYETLARSGFRAERLFDDPMVVVSTERRGAAYWDPKYISIDYDGGVKHQEAQLWGEFDETPHLSVSDISMGIEFADMFGGSIVIPKRMLDSDDLPCQLYEVPDQPQVERTAYILYSLDAMKTRLPGMSPQEIKESIIRQFEGEETIWSDGLHQKVATM